MKPRFVVPALALLAAVLALPALPASADDPPSVTLTADRPVYAYNQTATLTSKIVALNLDWIVQVQYPGSTTWKTLCYSVNVNTETRTCVLGTVYNAKTQALLIDTHGTQDTADDTIEAQANLLIAVRAAVGTTYYGYYVKSGSYAVFGKGASPRFATVSQPAFPGQRCLRHQVQRRYSSGWRTVKTGACLVEQKQGRVDWRWSGKHASRVKFRVRATFAGDAVNRANNGAWLYFKFR